jgi:hypothetical protein
MTPNAVDPWLCFGTADGHLIITTLLALCLKYVDLIKISSSLLILVHSTFDSDAAKKRREALDIRPASRHKAHEGRFGGVGDLLPLDDAI